MKILPQKTPQLHQILGTAILGDTLGSEEMVEIIQNLPRLPGVPHSGLVEPSEIESRRERFTHFPERLAGVLAGRRWSFAPDYGDAQDAEQSGKDDVGSGTNNCLHPVVHKLLPEESHATISLRL